MGDRVQSIVQVTLLLAHLIVVYAPGPQPLIVPLSAGSGLILALHPILSLANGTFAVMVE